MRTRTALAALTLVSALTLTACTGGDDGDSGGGGAEQAEGGSAAPASANPVDTVIAEQTVATPHGYEKGGGEVTVTLRAVEVAGDTMTVRWALRWDDDEAPADAGLGYFDMGLTPATTVTDGTNLKAYKPFCTEGAWKPTTPVEDQSLTDTIDENTRQTKCRASMLVSPPYDVVDFPNHGTVEGWSVLPAPQEKVETVDVLPVEGLPAFTGVEVAYAEGQE